MSLLPLLALVACGAQKRSDLAFDLAATQRALDTALVAEGPEGETVMVAAPAEAEPVLLEEEPDGLVEELMQSSEESLQPQAEESVELSAASMGVAEEPAHVEVDEELLVEEESALVTPGEYGPVVGPYGELSRSVGSSDELVRALDDLRNMMILEARLEDKQRLMDEMRKDLDRLTYGDEAPTAGVDAARFEARMEAMIQAQNKAAQAQAERDKALDARLAALETAQPKATPEEAPEAEPKAVEGEQVEAVVEAELVEDPRVAELEAALAASKAEAAEREEAQKAQDKEIQALAQAYAELEASKDLEEDALDFEQRQARRRARWERWTWWLGRQDEQKTERRGLRSERKAQKAEAKELNAADWAELEEQRQALALEQEQLARREADLEAQRDVLVSREAEVAEQKGNLQSHLEALELAEEEAAARGEAQDSERQAEIERLNAELEELKQVEVELASKEAELGEVRQRAAELESLEDEVEELRARAVEAEGMEATLAELEAREQANAERWRSALMPLTEAGLEAEIVGSQARVQLPSDVLFASGSASLSAEGKQTVASIGEVLAAMPGARVQVQGHTDDVPIRSQRYATNWDLAYARARGVLQGLEKAGVPSEHLSAASFGESRPLVPNTTSEGRALNRRIELVLELED